MKSLVLNKTLWLLIALFSFMSAFAGVLSPSIYTKVMAPSLMPAAMAQDLLTLIVILILIFLILKTKTSDTKLQLIIIGIIGSLGYLYAIFAIERVYNWFYLCYLAILGLVLYSVPISIGSLDTQVSWKLPSTLRWFSIIFSTFIGILFSFIWIGSLVPAMTTGTKIETYYSIYILDLVWIMPGFLATAYLSFRQKTLGLLLTPVMYILGIFVIFPLGLGELAKPFYGYQIDIGSMVMSFVLSGLFLLMSSLSLYFLKSEKLISLK